MNKRVLWITRTAIFLALLVVLQAVTRPMGQYVTGSLVNMVLILAVMLGGLWSGVCVAALSPWAAFLVGVGPAVPQVLPVVMLGNVALVLCWYFIAGRSKAKNTLVPRIIALVVGACAKFMLLYGGIVVVVIPIILKLPEPKASVLSAAFSFPQLITAGIGGAIAILLLPVLQKALKKPA